MSHIVSNLVANADRYAKSRITVSVCSAGEYGRLVVADDGPGFPAQLLPRAFDGSPEAKTRAVIPAAVRGLVWPSSRR